MVLHKQVLFRSSGFYSALCGSLYLKVYYINTHINTDWAKSKRVLVLIIPFIHAFRFLQESCLEQFQMARYSQISAHGGFLYYELRGLWYDKECKVAYE